MKCVNNQYIEKEIKSMSTITLNGTGHKSLIESGKRVSIMEKFTNYMTENSAIFISGLMMYSNTSIYNVYRMLNR